MHDPTFAVMLLALGTTTEKACAIEGDLLEQARTHGKLWFHLQVVLTTLALLRQSSMKEMAMILLQGYAVYELSVKLEWWLIRPLRYFVSREWGWSTAAVATARLLLWVVIACVVGKLLSRLLSANGFKVALLASLLLLVRVTLLQTNVSAGLLFAFGVLPMLLAAWHGHQRNLATALS